MMARALVISVIVNGVLVVLPALFDSAQFRFSNTGRIVDALGTPGGFVVERVLPGHGVPQVVLLLVSSVAFYAVIAWALLMAWTRLRKS